MGVLTDVCISSPAYHVNWIDLEVTIVNDNVLKRGSAILSLFFFLFALGGSGPEVAAQDPDQPGTLRV